MSASSSSMIARKIMGAIEPVVTLLVELGVTSPEAESVLRGIFVHEAREWLTRQVSSGERQSDVRVALVAGVHRNFVRRILAQSPRFVSKRARKSNHVSRLINAWRSDPAYLDTNGKPIDLPEKGDIPSFQSLARTYVPSASPGVVLSQLKRAKLIHGLSDQRVRISRGAFRSQSLNGNNIDEVTKRVRELLETLRHNTMHPNATLFCESLPDIVIPAAETPAVKKLIARRASSFLSGLQRDITSKTKKLPRPTDEKAAILRLMIYQTAFDRPES